MFIDFHIKKGKNMVIGGDFNIHFLGTDNSMCLLSDTVAAYGLGITVLMPSRITETSSKCLDNFIISDSLENYKILNIDYGISDHYCQIINILYVEELQKQDNRNEIGRNMNSENIERFDNFLCEETWL
ncbi:hypothetical protein JTB14_009719 [Gonioctena quinquepunctata]|nr:hypothetical protein JTB14_009719 [Gonioctena quinquepunctata]